MSNSNGHSFMHNEGWVFDENFSVSGQIENLWKLKFLQGHLHQILGIWAGRNLITAWCVNSLLNAHTGMQDESKIYKNQQIQLSNNTLINGILEGGVHSTWPDCNMYMYYGCFPKYDKN